jgi:dextranase
MRWGGIWRSRQCAKRSAAVQVRGGAALAYGAVYGAEPEYADTHPELALFDEAGQRISLAELFYIMNIAPSSPWVPLIVDQFAQAIHALDFDGIHLDQYGFPKTARTARAAVVAAKPSAGVIFNAVGNWPIATVAPTTQDVIYIEVWPPDESYNDLRRLIADAKRLGANKPVILAAYLAPFLDCAPEQIEQAEAAAFLSTAVIAASGGSQLLLGERDGILCDP